MRYSVASNQHSINASHADAILYSFDRYRLSGEGVLPYQNGGGVPPEPHGAHGEREIKKLRVTKRELLNN